MLQNKKWVSYESTTPNFERKTWEIKNVLVAALIFKKSWSLWTKAWLASSLLEQKLIPSNWPIIFVQPQQQLNLKKLGGKHDQKPQHNPKGNCTAEWSQFLFCLIMPAKISWFFQPIPVFVDNLAQNSTRFSLSNEPFLLINHVFSFFVFMQITYWAHLCTYKTITPRIFGRVFPFSQNNKHDPMFSQGFLGNQSLVQKTEIMLVFVQTNKFWKFRWFLWEVTIHLKTQKQKHHEVTPKAEFWLHE